MRPGSARTLTALAATAALAVAGCGDDDTGSSSKSGVERASLDVPDHMKGMDDDPARLKRADRFDHAFIKMMIPHHEGAIEMAKIELARGQHPELKAFAQEIIDARQREIDAMRKHIGDTPASDDAVQDEDHGAGHAG